MYIFQVHDRQLGCLTAHLVITSVGSSRTSSSKDGSDIYFFLAIMTHGEELVQSPGPTYFVLYTPLNYSRRISFQEMDDREDP